VQKANIRKHRDIISLNLGMRLMAKLVLVDSETGKRIRHRIRSVKQALKQQEWYEERLGRRVRIEKEFEK
jgi:hypothetical protein